MYYSIDEKKQPTKMNLINTERKARPVALSITEHHKTVFIQKLFQVSQNTPSKARK